MLRKGLTRCARMKKGQKSWTPNKPDAHSSSSFSSTTGSRQGKSSAPMMLVGSEVRQLVYRPLPKEHTVEYEEDIGHNIIIQREFYSPKLVQEVASFEMVPLCGSGIELQKGRERLANNKSVEEHGAALTSSGETQPIFESSVEDNDPVGSVQSARYLFDDERMRYVERFDRNFLQIAEESDSSPDKGFAFNSLKEVCAILFGCKSEETREAWFRSFLRLDRKSLEEEAEALRGIVAAGERTASSEAATTAAASTRSSESVWDFDQEGQGEGEEEGDGATAESHMPIPYEYAPLIESYSNFSQGKTRIAGSAMEHLKGTVGASGRLHERYKQRALIERLVREDFSNWSDEDLLLAEDLSDQLRSVKLFRVKVGESVREAVELQKHGAAGGGSLHDTRSTVRSSNAPDAEARASDNGAVLD